MVENMKTDTDSILLVHIIRKNQILPSYQFYDN